jgi:hypothetical protein
VQVGVRNAKFSQVSSGLIAGEPVITSGGYALPDKTQIKIEAPAAEEKEAEDKAGKGKEEKAADPKPTKKVKE